MLDVDDLYPEHPKLVRLGTWCEVAGWLNLAALCWCKRYRTDGVIPRMTVWRLALFRGMTIDGTGVTPERVAEHLVAVGLWRDDGTAYVVPDFLDYQESRAHTLARKERDRQRKADGRARAERRRALDRARQAKHRAGPVTRDVTPTSRVTSRGQSADVTRDMRVTGSAQVGVAAAETGQFGCPQNFRADSRSPFPLSPLPVEEKDPDPDARTRSNRQAACARTGDRMGPQRASPVRLGEVLARAYAAAGDRGRP